MADYTDVSSVRAVLPNEVPLDDTTSVPSVATANLWIAQVTNQVNIAFKAGGASLPIAVTETDILGALKLVCAREVAYQVMVTRGAVEDPKNKPLWTGYHEEYEEMLEKIEEGKWMASLVGSSKISLAETDNDPRFERDRDY